MQYAGINPVELGRELDGREWKEQPDINPDQLSFL